MTILNFLVADAYAVGATAATTTTAAPSTGQGLLSLLPMLGILVVFMYFMVIRPQSKKVKEQRTLLAGLQSGDEIMTIGGVLGRIEKITDSFIVLNIAEGVNVSVQKNAVASCMPKGTMKGV